MTPRKSDYSAELAEIASLDSFRNIEFSARWVLLGLPVLMGYLVLDMSILPIWYVIYFILIMSQRASMALLPSARGIQMYAAVLGLNGLAATVFAALPVYLWYFDDPFLSMGGILLLVGAMQHALMVRSVQVALVISSTLPPAIAMLTLPAAFLGPGGQLTTEAWMSFVAVVFLLGYFAVSVRNGHVMRRELVEATNSAHAANQAKSQFLATMSHELRTPLNGVVGMAEQLRNQRIPPGARGQVEVLAQSARHLTAIVDDLLDLTRIEANQLQIRPVLGQLHEEIRSVYQLHKPSAEEKGLRMYLTIAVDVPEVARFDPVRLRQGLNNLVSNAVKYTARGTVTITVTRTNPVAAASASPSELMVSMAVSDTGRGIMPGDIPGLFERFRTGRAAIETEGRNAGLGLAITRDIARLMGGDVHVESIPGIGSTFRLELPVDTDATRSSLLEDPQPLSGTILKGARILVVDDVSTNRMVARSFLEAAGATALEATSGEGALMLLGTHPVDAVLMDVHMPGLNGVETLRAIRGANTDWSGIPVIAITADAAPEDRERYLSAGMSGYVSKPVDRRNLISEVRRLLVLPSETIPEDATIKTTQAATAVLGGDKPPP